MSLDSYQERQKNEFQVLQSIFEDNLQDLCKAAWNVSGPLHIKLSLKPQQSMGGVGQAYVSVDMIVNCPTKYPDELPELELANVKGVSHQLIKELKEDLKKQAAENIGEVMIWELANTVQEFLYKNNRPPEQSFHEQMMKNRKEELERRKEQQRLLAEEERQKIEAEVLRHQAAMRNEKQKRKDDHKNAEWSTPAITVPRQPSFSPTPSPILPSSPSRSKQYDEITNQQTPTGTFAIPFSRRRRRTSTPKQGEEDESATSPSKDYSTGVTALNFVCNKIDKRINRGIFLGHSVSGSTVYAGMDATTGELVAVADWVLKWRSASKKPSSLDKGEDTEGTAYMKQVSAIEQEICTLVKLRHPNLIHYLAMKSQYDPGKIAIHILTEYSGGSNLAVHIHRKEQLPLEVLRSYTTEVLEALKYLHKNSIVHKDLRPSSVFVDSCGKIRLSDYSIGKRLGDLYTTVHKSRPGVHFSDAKPMVIGRGQKGDIYQLGLMLLTLILGKPLTETIPDIPKSLPSALQDFLNKCLLTDERVRGTAAQLREHNFIKEPLQQVMRFPDSSNKFADKSNIPKVEEEEDCINKDDENFEYLLSLVASGQSRLTSEFELIKVLGKGGFGDVLKVKNKLDGRFYAIKRIPINPKSKLFNKKMKREVKLLSRLNHENVVRYYCSWIEVSDDPAHSDTSSFTSSSRTAEPPPASKKAPHIVKSIPLTKTPVLKTGLKSNQSLDPIGDLDNLVPQVSDESIEWLTSFDQDCTVLDSSDDEEEDEADVFGSSFMPKLDASDDSIVFGNDDSDETESESKSEVQMKETSITLPDIGMPSESEDNVMKLLYIQMEYCEKSTLRNCIDDGLCQDMDRVWRLFREVVEGLVHIHGQGMIHRDLKPVNIFLDYNDHVKIGDFGLATTDILVKGGAADLTLPSPQDIVTVHHSRSNSSDGNLTGKVGTALYVSPEVMQGNATKVHYDQKVDIYSLGIIFFEMCYKSLPTGMERVKIISNLRLPTVELPTDFQGDKFHNQMMVILWLLNHDPSLRPTSKELLSSDLLPPALMQENGLIEMLKSTIAQPLSSSHRHMLNTIFDQNIKPHSDFTYDHENYESSISNQTALIYKKVEESLVKVFTNHGALHIPTPLFMPELGIYEGNEQCVRLMDHKGGIVMAPMDHRVPFARFVGRCGVKRIKRYAIEKVFRERKLYSVHDRVHPRELTECSFDIITPTLNLIPDAEVLAIVQEIINEFPTLKARNYYIRISHISILKAIFLHYGIPETKHHKALTIVSENYTNKQKRLALLESELKLSLSEQSATQLTLLLDLEGPLGRVSSHLKSITKSMGQASSLCKSGLHDLEHILSYANHLELNLEVMICVGLVYNPNQFSGLMFQVICDSKKKKRIVPEVLAAGGRYDQLIEKYMSPLHSSASRSAPHGVGISISFDRLVAVVAEDKEMKSLSPYDVVICSLGHQLLLNKKLAIAKTLWNAGFRTMVHYDKIENFGELEVNCREQGVSNIIILKDGESSKVKVLWLEQERTFDSIVTIGQFVDSLRRGTHETFTNSNHGEAVTTVNTNTNTNTSNSSLFNFSIQFHIQEKSSGKSRRRHEAMIAGKVTTSFPWLPEKNVEVLALDISISLVKAIQAYLELGDEQSFEASKDVVVERSMKHRKFLTGVFDVIHDLRFKRKRNYIILYSMEDEAMRLLT